MAEPWADDLAALGEHTRHQLRSLDATRASLSDRKETKMRFYKAHPALAAVIVLVSLGLFSGLAYAVVHRVLISIDADKSAPEIEDDVRQQLQAAGVNADIRVDKSDEDGKRKLEVSVTSEDPNAPEIGVQVKGDDPDHADSRRAEMRLEVHCELTPDQQKLLRDTVRSDDVIGVLKARADGATDADLAAKIAAALATHGFHDVDVVVAAESLTITIKSPPTP